MKKTIFTILIFLLLFSTSWSIDIFDDKVEYFEDILSLSEEQRFDLEALFFNANMQKRDVLKHKGRIKKLKEAFKMNTEFQKEIKSILSRNQYRLYQYKKAELLAERELKRMKSEISFEANQFDEVSQIVNEINLIYEEYKGEEGVDTIIEKLAYLNKIRVTMKSKDKRIMRTLSSKQKKQYKEFVKEVRETIG